MSDATSKPQGLTAFAYGEAIFNERRIVDDLIEKEFSPRLQHVKLNTSIEKLFFEQFQRVRCWVMSLGRLGNANDFQAVIACDRALFEMTVDLTLLRFQPLTYTPEKMLAWDNSAKLKAAKTVERHFAKRKQTVPAKFQPQMKFIATHEASIVASRAQYFALDAKGKPRHPRRWTEQSLETDARVAHEATPKDHAWDVDLEEFYATRHDRICWNVHGSGVVGLRFVAEEDVPILGAEAMHECLDMAVRCTNLVAVQFGIVGAALKAAFEKCRLHRVAMVRTVLQHHDSTAVYP